MQCSKRLISCIDYSSRLANVASVHVMGQLADRDTGVGSAKGSEPWDYYYNRYTNQLCHHIQY